MPKIEEYNESANEVQERMQSDERRDIASKTIARFYDLRTLRSQKFEFIRNRTPLEYFEDSVMRVSQFREKPAWKKWWQSNLASPTPRNKLIGILSKLAANYMMPTTQIEGGVNLVNRKKEQVSNAILKDSLIKGREDRQFILEMYEAMAKGTVIGFEGWKRDRRIQRIVIDEDPETGEIKSKEEEIDKWNDVYGEIVPVEDIYFGDWFVNDVQDMDDIAWRTILKEDNFKSEFGSYTDADLVIPGNLTLTINEEKTIFYQRSEDIKEDEIEIIRYFNQKTDEYIMIANGIWINPMKDDVVSPLPWNHKRLPFWLAKFEILDSKFILGKSIADKMISDIDTEDKLFNNILDRLYMALKAPIVIQGTHTSLTETYLEPDNVIEMDEEGGKATRLDLGEPGTGSYNMLQILQARINQSSIDPEQLGASAGKAKTATEVSIEREGALQLVSLFVKLMEFGQRDKYNLRLYNMYQFYTLPSNKKDKRGRFKVIELRDELLSDGTIGTQEISFVNKVNQNEVEQEAKETPGNISKIQITNAFLRDTKANIVITPKSSLATLESEAINKEVQFQKMVFALYPDLANKEAMFQDLVMKFRDKDIKRIKAPQQEASVEGGGEMGIEQILGGQQGAGGQETPQDAVRALEGDKSLKELI